MKKVLMIGNQFDLANRVSQELSNQYSVSILDNIDFNNEKNYLDSLVNTNIICFWLNQFDADLAMEALIAALDQVNPPIEQFVVLSVAGIDDELTTDAVYENIDDVKEYLNQQRYAVKLVDEYELPYTVLRPVKIVDHTVGDLDVIDEGRPMPFGEVSTDSIAKTAAKVVKYQQFINQSIGLIER